jgi:hypothetical protein
MAQAVSRRPPTAKTRVRSSVSPCGICCRQSGAGTGFSPNARVFPCQFHSTGVPLLGKGQKIIITDTPLGDTGAASVQKTAELSSATAEYLM